MPPGEGDAGAAGPWGWDSTWGLWRSGAVQASPALSMALPPHGEAPLPPITASPTCLAPDRGLHPHPLPCKLFPSSRRHIPL